MDKATIISQKVSWLYDHFSFIEGIYSNYPGRGYIRYLTTDEYIVYCNSRHAAKILFSFECNPEVILYHARIKSRERRLKVYNDKTKKLKKE